jgi:hypothetical protein
LAAEDGHNDGIHNQLNVMQASELSAQLCPHGRIKAPHKQGAKYGGVHRAPIQFRGFGNPLHVIRGHIQGGLVLEQIAVEAPDGFQVEVPADGHGLEKLG